MNNFPTYQEESVQLRTALTVTGGWYFAWLVCVYLFNVSFIISAYLFANKTKIALSINKLAAVFSEQIYFKKREFVDSKLDAPSSTIFEISQDLRPVSTGIQNRTL